MPSTGQESVLDMLQLPRGFTHGEIVCARRVGGLTLAEVVYRPNVRTARHSHPDARFVLVLRGSLSEELSAGSLVHEAASLLFRPAHEPHALSTGDRGARCLIVEVDATWLQQAHRECALVDEPMEYRGGLLLHLARRLHGEFRLRDEVSRLVIASLVLGIAAEASRRSAREACGHPRPPAWLQEAHELLGRRFAHAPSLAGIASTVGVHPVHLARAFRQWYRCTVGDYLRELRLEFACQQMAATDASLADIALAAGFCDQSHLTRLCRDRLGMTPAEYRAIHRSPRPFPAR
jgi:AraC family transcriptional regulator